RRSNAQAPPERDRNGRREADERSDRAVRAALREERALQLEVHTVEHSVVPLEASARPRNRGYERKQDRAEDPSPTGRAFSAVGLGEDGGGRLPLELLDREARVV